MRVDDSTACVDRGHHQSQNIVRLWKYIDLARAKSETPDSLLNQNMKSCNAPTATKAPRPVKKQQ